MAKQEEKNDLHVTTASDRVADIGHHRGVRVGRPNERHHAMPLIYIASLALVVPS